VFFPIWACLLIVVVVPGLILIGHRRGTDEGLVEGETKLRLKYKSMYGDVLCNLAHYRNLGEMYGSDETTHDRLKAEQAALKASYQESLQAIEALLYARDCMGEEADYDEELVSMHKESFEHWMTKGLGEVVANGKKVLQIH